MISLQSDSAQQCSQLLAARNKTLAFAESATAGSLMSAFACTRHSGAVLTGGIVCYDAAVKTGLLKVSAALISQYTAESIPVTKAITVNLSQLMKADFYVGITGLIKEGGSASPDKPVGTIFTCIKTKADILIDKSFFEGDEVQILHQTLENLCMLLIDKLSADSL